MPEQLLTPSGVSRLFLTTFGFSPSSSAQRKDKRDDIDKRFPCPHACRVPALNAKHSKRSVVTFSATIPAPFTLHSGSDNEIRLF